MSCINSQRRSRSELYIASARHHALIHRINKIISILTRLIKKCLHFKMFYRRLISSRIFELLWTTKTGPVAEWLRSLTSVLLII